MAISTGAAILGGALASGAAGIIGGNKQAGAIKDAANTAADADRYRTEQSIRLTAPQREVGNQALNVLGSMFIPGYTGFASYEGAPVASPASTTAQQPRQIGFFPGLAEAGIWNTPSVNAAADATGISQPGGEYVDRQPGGTMYGPMASGSMEAMYRNLPGVEFMVNEARRGVENSSLVSGISGNQMAELADRNRNLAYQSVVPNLMTLAGFGNAGAANAAAMAASSQVPSIMGNAGVAGANAIGAQYSSVNNAIQGGLQNWMTYRGVQGSPVTQPTLQTIPYSQPQGFVGPPAPAAVNPYG